MFGFKGGASTFVVLGIVLAFPCALFWGIVGFIVCIAIFVCIAIASHITMCNSPAHIRHHVDSFKTETRENIPKWRQDQIALDKAIRFALQRNKYSNDYFHKRTTISQIIGTHNADIISYDENTSRFTIVMWHNILNETGYNVRHDDYYYYY